jgi:hypothetical protein
VFRIEKRGDEMSFSSYFAFTGKMCFKILTPRTGKEDSNLRDSEERRLWHRVALAGTEVSEEHIASIISVKRLGEIGKLSITNRHALPERRFLQDPHEATSQKTSFFIVTAMKPSNFT